MKTKSQWASRLGFIMATVGAAIGLGNLWKLFYPMGRNGGASSLVIYLFSICILGMPVMVLEMSLGRKTRHGPAQVYGGIYPNARTARIFGVAMTFLILPYYSVIGGWITKYIVSYGTTFHASEDSEVFISAPTKPASWYFPSLFMTTAICYHSISGIEDVSRIMVPLFSVLLIVAIVRSATLPDVILGLEFIFIPNSAAFNMKAVSTALGQAFYSLNLCMGITIAYGSYLGGKESIPRSYASMAGLDTIVAVMAGIAIFPAVFSFGLEPRQGLGLIFGTLPKVFVSIKGGSVFVILFFALMLLAAVTSVITLLEVVVSFVVDSLKQTRKKAAVILGLLIFLTGTPSALPFDTLGNVTILNYNVFDFIGMAMNNTLLPFGGLAIYYFIGWKWNPRYLVNEVERDGVTLGLKKLQIFCTHFFTPILVAAVTLTGFANIYSIVRGQEYTYG